MVHCRKNCSRGCRSWIYGSYIRYDLCVISYSKIKIKKSIWKKQKPNNSEYFELSTKVIQGVKNLNAQLIVTVSRRTPNKAIKILQSTFSKHLSDFKILSSDKNNFYPKILEIIDYTIVTSDSVNMISELATLSKPLFIIISEL